MHPNDFGKLLVEDCQKIKIWDLVRKYQDVIIRSAIQAEVESMGIKIGFTSTTTGFGGKRVWFTCPLCQQRVGILYYHPFKPPISCRKCLGLRYKKSRYKGMPENDMQLA